MLGLSRYGRLGASSRLRTFQYKIPLSAFGVELDVRPLFDDAYVEAIYNRTSRRLEVLWGLARRIALLITAKRYDAIWIEKEALPWLPVVAEIAFLPRQTPIILDYDDAIFHRYDMHRIPVVRALLGKKLDKLMAQAALTVAGNEYIAQRARAAGARHVEVIPTIVDLQRYALVPRRFSDSVTIGWIGTPNTAPYLDIVKPVIEALARSFRVRAVAIGARPDQVAGSRFQAVPWSEDTEVDLLREVDIGIMPLADSPWERGKCGYKIIQFMALGIPVVASPVGVNATIVRPHANGLLASTDAEWLAALGALAGSSKDREVFGRSARRTVEAGYSLAMQTPRLAKLIRQVADHGLDGIER